MGSASDSGRRTGNSDSEPDASLSEKPKKKKINERSVDTEKKEDGLTYEQIQQNTQMKRPKRNGSTLSRFSHIFKNDGKKLSDALTEEFRLNDRFSGKIFVPCDQQGVKFSFRPFDGSNLGRFSSAASRRRAERKGKSFRHDR